MARRRSILGDLWLQLSLQAALAVSAANAADTAHTMQNFLASSADDAFVLTSAASQTLAEAPAAASSFEDFSLAFYLPAPVYDPSDYSVLPDLDAALLGGLDRTYDWHSNDVLL